jgi:hypothetical protein
MSISVALPTHRHALITLAHRNLPPLPPPPPPPLPRARARRRSFRGNVYALQDLATAWGEKVRARMAEVQRSDAVTERLLLVRAPRAGVL